MTRVTRSGDCGNSPRNTAAETLALALEGGEWVADLLDEDSRWNPATGRARIGADAIRKAAKRLAPDAIRIERVATHGAAGAVSGVTDGKAFAHVLTFTTAAGKRIATIDSFRKTETKNA